MITDKETAKIVCETLIETSEKFKGTLDLVSKNCTESEVERYKQAIAKVLGNMMLGIRNPIYLEHPDLVPEGMKDIYARNKKVTNAKDTRSK